MWASISSVSAAVDTRHSAFEVSCLRTEFCVSRKEDRRFFEFSVLPINQSHHLLSLAVEGKRGGHGRCERQRGLFALSRHGLWSSASISQIVRGSYRTVD